MSKNQLQRKAVKQIRKYQLANNLSDTQLSNMLQTYRSTLSRWYRLESLPSMKKLKEVESALGLQLLNNDTVVVPRYVPIYRAGKMTKVKIEENFLDFVWQLYRYLNTKQAQCKLFLPSPDFAEFSQFVRGIQVLKTTMTPTKSRVYVRMHHAENGSIVLKGVFTDALLDRWMTLLKNITKNVELESLKVQSNPALISGLNLPVHHE